jgi:hypothetical protein
MVNFLHNNILISKSRRVRWAGHVEFRGQKQNTYRAFIRKPEERDHLVELLVDTDYIIHWITHITRACNGLMWLRAAKI